MNALEQQLLDVTVGEAKPRFVIRTRRRIDAGRWWRRTRVWLCVMADELVLLAVARRQYVERVPLAECGESRYCHAGGELVLAPVKTLTFSRFAMSPREALSVLRVVRTHR